MTGAVVELVTPVFGVLALGYGAARFGGFDAQATRGLSLFVFNFVIPPLLFRSMATAELPGAPPWGLLLSFYLSTLLVMTLGMLAGRVFGRRLDAQAMFGFGAAYGNTVLMGVPLVLISYGDPAALPLFVLIAVHSPLLMTLLTLLLEAGRDRPDARLVRVALLSGGKGLVSNPVVLSLLAGLAVNLAGWRLAGPVDAITAALAQAAMPGALFAVGAALSRYRLAGSLSEALTLTALKNLLHPLLVWLAAVYLFALPPLWAQVATLLAALPSGVNGYLFAQRYQLEVGAVSSTIFLSTVASLATLPAVLWLLRP